LKPKHTLIKPTAQTAVLPLPDDKLFDFKSYYNRDNQLLLNLVAENNKYDGAVTFSLGKEFFNFIKFAGFMLLAFPVAVYMRSRIRKNKRLNYILQFKELLTVRNNIEKGSFAYDTLLFKQSPLGLLQNKSHLANLVCLAILFGDEFIDGIAMQYGKRNIQNILGNDDVDYYLCCRQTGDGWELYYQFDICNVLPEGVLNSTNSKYGINYKTFYGHLLFLLEEINVHLNKLKRTKQAEAAALICKVCNRCFDTYKTDITAFNIHYTLTDLLQYQKTKDDDIIQVLLTLRAVLLDKKQLQYQKQFTSWSSIVRSMQLYDDMQDAPADCDYQMNMLCYLAQNYCLDEWLWLQQHKYMLQKQTGLALHAAISLNMPASCMLCQQFARNIAYTKLNWQQCKIQNYLWRKNWLGFNNPLLGKKGGNVYPVIDKDDNSIAAKLRFIHTKIMQVDVDVITTDMKLAHVVDTALLDEELKKHIFKAVTAREKYFLTSCYLQYPVKSKAALASKLLCL